MTKTALECTGVRAVSEAIYSSQASHRESLGAGAWDDEILIPLLSVTVADHCYVSGFHAWWTRCWASRWLVSQIRGTSMRHLMEHLEFLASKYLRPTSSVGNRFIGFHRTICIAPRVPPNWDESLAPCNFAEVHHAPSYLSPRIALLAWCMKYGASSTAVLERMRTEWKCFSFVLNSRLNPILVRRRKPGQDIGWRDIW